MRGKYYPSTSRIERIKACLVRSLNYSRVAVELQIALIWLSSTTLCNTPRRMKIKVVISLIIACLNLEPRRRRMIIKRWQMEALIWLQDVRMSISLTCLRHRECQQEGAWVSNMVYWMTMVILAPSSFKAPWQWMYQAQSRELWSTMVVFRRASRLEVFPKNLTQPIRLLILMISNIKNANKHRKINSTARVQLTHELAQHNASVIAWWSRSMTNCKITKRKED